MTDNPLVGAWRLMSFEVRGADGRVRYPYGRDAAGYIIYGADGFMSVQFGPADRPRFADDDLGGKGDGEWAALARSYTAYCGRYELRGDRVLHHVELSLFPNWVGETQERFLTLDGNRAILRTPPFLVRGEERTGVLVWERVSRGPAGRGGEG